MKLLCCWCSHIIEGNVWTNAGVRGKEPLRNFCSRNHFNFWHEEQKKQKQQTELKQLHLIQGGKDK